MLSFENPHSSLRIPWDTEKIVDNASHVIAFSLCAPPRHNTPTPTPTRFQTFPTSGLMSSNTFSVTNEADQS
jgi:hypothetical protein